MTPDLKAFRAHLEHRGDSNATITNYLCQVRQPEGPARVRSRSLAPKSRRVALAAWRAYGRFLEREGDPEGPSILADLADVRLPSPVRETPQVPLPRSTWDALRDALSDMDAEPATRAALGIIASRGLRSIDVRWIQRKEVDLALKNGVLSFLTKGDRRVEFGVTKVYRGQLEILAEEFDGSGCKIVWELIAPSPKAAHSVLERALKRVARSIDLGSVELDDVRLHILRRTYATSFFEACGRDLVRLQQHMGWANVATAANYVDHSRREELDQVAESMFE